jgi:hypothetical protein
VTVPRRDYRDRDARAIVEAQERRATQLVLLGLLALSLLLTVGLVALIVRAL